VSLNEKLSELGETSVLNKWYRACRNDTGEVWCESRNPNEVRRRSEGVEVTIYSQTDYRVSGPWEQAK
jgi:hypothetical protein